MLTITTVKPTAAIMGAGLGKDVALITDGRFSGASHVSVSKMVIVIIILCPYIWLGFQGIYYRPHLP
jgi:hypothetical protein